MSTITLTVYGSEYALNARLQLLAHNRQWLNLLHFEHGKPTFTSPSFYLTESIDPFAEIKALVSLADTPITNEQNHPRCRFPARYAWLGKQLDRPEWITPPAACRKLHKWLDQHRLTGASIMLVSGYMGNPASLFGHAFLKLDTADQTTDLWQTSLSYGAQVPPGENTLRYVFKGLTGGYTATYTDRYFYNQDLSYTRTEARDMWEYPLELTADQLRLLQMHIWEVTNRKKRYYFLTHNCAYELGHLLEGAVGRPAMHPPRLWYLPEELVQQAQEADLTGKAIYHPAAERQLIWHYEQLPARLQRRADAFMTEKKSLAQTLDRIDAYSRLALLDFLLTYQHFLTMQQMPNPSEQTRKLRLKLIRARLSLPPSRYVLSDPPFRPSPLDGERAGALWFGPGYFSTTDQWRTLMGFSPYARTTTNASILDGDELTLLWTEASFNRNTIQLEQLDYIRIMHHALSPLPKASPWSWQLLLRSKRLADGHLDHQAHFGVGTSLKKGHAIIYALVTPAIHSAAPQLRLQGGIGLIASLTGQLRLHASTSVENGQTDLNALGRLTLHHALTHRFGWTLDGRWRSNNEGVQISLQLQWRF